MLLYSGAFSAPQAQAQVACQLCTAGPPATAKPVRTLTIAIDAMLDFSTAAHGDSGQGSIQIDPRTGARQVRGGLVALGGMAVKGTVRLTGDPFRHVRITLPSSVTMHSTMGATADIGALITDVSADPVLGADGTLSFSFGATMTVRDGAAGDFHGVIPISAEYQ